MHVFEIMEASQNVVLCVTLETFYYLREISILVASFIHMLTPSIKLNAAAFSHGVIVCG